MKNSRTGFRRSLNVHTADVLTLRYVLFAIGWVVLVELIVYVLRLPPSTRFLVTTFRAFALIGITAYIIFQLASQKDLHYGQKVDAIEVKYKLLFDRNPVPMWIYETKSYRFLIVNTAAQKHYGYTLDEFRRMTLWDIRPPDEHAELKRRLDEVRNTDHVFSGVWRHRKKNGEIIHVEIDSLIIDYEGEACRMVLATDVSKLVSLQKESKNIADELSHFVYRASHDLRGPIARMIGLSIMIERDKEYMSKYIQSLQHTAQQMDDMLTRLISVNLLKTYRPEFVPVNLKNLVDDVLLQAGVAHSGFVTVQNLVDQKLAITADPKIIRLVLENLLDNAVKYRKDGVPCCIWIRANQENDQVYIQVEDNGIGIREEVKGSIFNIFFRGTEKSEGSGLGLYIVQEALKCHQGTIRVGAPKEASTLFEVVIPRCA